MWNSEPVFDCSCSSWMTKASPHRQKQSFLFIPRSLLPLLLLVTLPKFLSLYMYTYTSPFNCIHFSTLTFHDQLISDHVAYIKRRKKERERSFMACVYSGFIALFLLTRQQQRWTVLKQNILDSLCFLYDITHNPSWILILIFYNSSWLCQHLLFFFCKFEFWLNCFW